MENNDINAYKKIADIITLINNPNNFKKARLTFDRISHNKNPVFKFLFSSKKKSENSINKEISITELPFIEKVSTFFLKELHELSPKNNCKAKLCECSIKFDEDRKFLLMWELIYYFYFPMENKNWDNLSSEHLKHVLSNNFENIFQDKILLLQQIRILFSEIREEYPPDTLLNKNGLEDCIFKKQHDTEFLEVKWESKSRLEISEHINQNLYRPILGLQLKQETFSKYRIDRVRCRRCNTEFYILREAIVEEKDNGAWNTIYSTLSQNMSIKYISRTDNLHYYIWKALRELFEIHGLTKKQAEVAAKLNMGIPLKQSTLRNTKTQLKKKLENVGKILEIWEELEWI